MSEDDNKYDGVVGRWLALGILIFLFIFTHHGIRGQNDLSRFVAVGALVNHGVFHIDNSPWTHEMAENDGEKYHVMNDLAYNEDDGHFYSSKPPVLTVILAGILKPLDMLGVNTRFIKPYDAAPTFLLTWLLIGTMTALGFYAFCRVLTEYLPAREAGLVTVLSLGGTLFLAYSTTMNHHTFTAALILIAFFLLSMHEPCRDLNWVKVAFAGALMGLAVTVDCGPGFIFSLLFGIYLICYTRSIPVVIAFGAGAVPPLFLHSVVQYSIWGSILPVQMFGATKFEAAYWAHAVGPDSWEIGRWKYWLLTLFSARGLFVLSPVLLVGCAGLWETIRDAVRCPGGTEDDGGAGYVALTVVAGMLFLFVQYSFFASTNFGGSCFGFRWYIGFMPLLSWYAARFYVRHRENRRLRHIFYILGLISLVFALIGMQYPWTLMEANPHPAVRVLLFLRGF